MIEMGTQRYAAAVNGRRRRPRLAAATLVVAALAASCGSDGEQTGDGAEDATAVVGDGSVSTEDLVGNGSAAEPSPWVDALSLGELEMGGGLGSAATGGAEAIGDPARLGDDWFEYAEPLPPLDGCRFGDPQASVQRVYLNGLSGESAGININVYRSADEAQAALDQITSEGYKPCLEAGFDAIRTKIEAQGIYDEVTAEVIGDAEPSLLDDRPGSTQRYTFEAIGPTSTLTLEATATHYAVGQALVSIEVTPFDDRHKALTEAAAAMVADDIVWTPDPVVDDAIDRLRLSVLGPESPARFYQLIQPAMVDVPSPTDCGGPPAGIGELDGPLWATSQGISAVFQAGTAYPDEAAAIDALALLGETDPACVYGIVSQRLAGTATYDGGEIRTETVNGREMVILDVSMTQELDGSSVPVDVAGITVFVRVGTDVLAWHFIGIRGDEPDLTSLATSAADQLEARPS